jgi:hypothetical protein
MAASQNPAAPQHLPWFITAPGQTDGLFVAMVIFLVVVLVLLGVFYFKLHALPEHIAHRTSKIQMEVVAVLAVLALFTHEHMFWIAALLLALIEVPDFSTPINTMAQSLQKLARRGRPAAAEPELSLEPASEASPALAPDANPATVATAAESTPEPGLHRT